MEIIILAEELTLIRDVSFALKKFLKENLVEFSGDSSIIFDSPGDIQNPPTPYGLSLFLYQVNENPFMKNNGNIPVSSNTLQKNQLFLDLVYLFTPYASNRDTEQILLTKLLRLLYDNSSLKGSILGTELLDSGNQELFIVSNDLTIEKMQSIWLLFPGKSFKLGISYTVSSLKIPSVIKAPSQRVISKQLEFYQISDKKG